MVTKEQLTKAAKLRDEGATWNAIREATGTKLGSSGWFRAWEKENIPHRPAKEKIVTDQPTAKERKAATAKAKAEAKPAPKAKAQPKVKRAPQKGAAKTKLSEAVKAANVRGKKVAPKGGVVSKEQVIAGWEHLSPAEQEGFRQMGISPEEAK
jgi:hypothetical protein